MQKTGFTLIELLIVITIIGILAVALLPSVVGAPARARDAQRKADLKNIATAIESFNSDYSHYPDGGGCVNAVTDSKVTGVTGVLNKYFQGGTPPKDPQGKGVGNSNSGSSCTGDYLYCPLTCTSCKGANYLVASFVEKDGDGNYNYNQGDHLCGSISKVPVLAPAKPPSPEYDTYIIIK